MKVTANPFFVGGDSRTFEYDFGLKVANSVSECPMKIYSASVNLAALPAPTDPIWREIREQRLLDRLKTQNNTGLVETATNKVTDYVVHHKAPIDGLLGAEIEGRTIKNEVAYDPTTWAGWVNNNVIGDVNGLVFNTSTTTRSSSYINSNLKVSTRYGVLMNVISNTANSKFYAIMGGTTIDPIININSTTGNIKFTATTQATIITNRLYISDSSYASADGGSLKLRDIRIFELPPGSEIEADFTNLTADQLAAKYPFGGTSALLNVKPTKVRSVGKNLIPTGIWELGDISATDGLNVSATTRVRTKDYIRIKPATTYTSNLVASSASLFILYDSDFRFSRGLAISVVGNTITTLSKEYYVKMVNYTTDLARQTQLEEGSTATAYEAYKEISIDLTAEALDLKKLPNGAADEVNLQTGESTKKVGSVVFNGAAGESWALSMAGNTTGITTTFILDFPNMKPDASSISDRLSYNTGTNVANGVEGLGTSRTLSRFIISISNTKLTTQDVAGFKAWLAANPVTVYYELATPVTTKLTADTTTLPSYKTGSLIVDANMPPVLNEWHTTDVNDDGVMVYGSSTSGLAIANMVEVDLTPVCNALYGGSNAAMKGGIKSIGSEAWGMATGVLSGALAYGTQLQLWNGLTNVYSTSFGANSTNNISKISYSTGTIHFITASNKLYILILSQYPSGTATDGVTQIPSTLQLDYVNVKVEFTRVADVLPAYPVNLPKRWAMVVKGWSPCYDENGIISNSRIVDIGGKIDLRIIGTKIFQFTKYGTATTTLQSSVQTFLKNQSYNIIFGQNSSGMFLNVLKNNSVTEKKTNADTQDMKGSYSLYVGSSITGLLQSNAFLESLHLIDLDKFRPLILGSELVTNGDFSNGGTGWSVNSGTWDFSSGKAVLTATADLQYLYQYVNVLPNSKYKIKFDVLQSNTNFVVRQYDSGNTVLSSSILDVAASPSGEYYMTTLSNCVKVRIDIRNSGVTTGTFTFDNISLKQVLQDGFTDAEAELILRGRPRENEVKYDPNTWAEWTKSAGVVGDSSGLELTADGAASKSGLLSNIGLKSSTKYGYLFNVISMPAANTKFQLDVNNYLGALYTPTSSGYHKKVGTTPATITDNKLFLYYQTDTAGNKIKLKDIRVFELPAGSQIESDFTNLTADQLAAKYPMDWKEPVPFGLENPELFDISKVTLHANATRSGNTITLNDTSSSKATSYIYIPILPNNRYVFNCKIIGSGGRVRILQYYNNILLSSGAYLYDNILNEIIINDKCNRVYIELEKQTTSAGTFTFSNISLKRKD